MGSNPIEGFYINDYFIMTTYYECHVTLVEYYAARLSELQYAIESRKWKFSVIDGDILLGAGRKCYATRLFNIRKGVQQVQSELFQIANELETMGFTVLRRKIEHVIFDDRSSKTQCTGGCIECHLDDLARLTQW